MRSPAASCKEAYAIVIQPRLMRRNISRTVAGMADVEPRRPRRCKVLPLPDEVALVLQGGGALGSYQAGVYEALAEASIDVDWVAGISIGAVNAAIIAGNPPDARAARLRQF
jgi:NTE family protein